MRYARLSGILLHPTSLPGPYGIGEIGAEARRFADSLAQAGQHLWQVLPLGPTSYGDSPYQALSTFAGNPLILAFDDLLADGLLTPDDLADFPSFDPMRIDYGPVIEARFAVLRRVCEAFDRRAKPRLKTAFARYVRDQADWLDDYALFLALKDDHGGRPWTEWEPDLIAGDEAALDAARARLAGPIRHVRIQQFLFDRQWRALRRHAHGRGVRIVGDIPIFVAHDSADVWSRPELFHLHDNGQPRVVAGVPPDYFSATGQLWGNPLYDWMEHRESGYAWWIARQRRLLDWVDWVRLDHFRGFEAYWEIPGGEPTAVHGRWVEGPGAELFQALETALGRLPIIAEDLGVITPPVEALRDRFHYPGMKILQFFVHDLQKDPAYRPEDCPENRVMYTGTHDNDTTVGWFTSAPGRDSTSSPEEFARERRLVKEYLGTDGAEIHWDLIALAWRSRARMALAPLQDVLGLGTEARMNMPGRPGGNWQWRFAWDQLTPALLERLRALTLAHGRTKA